MPKVTINIENAVSVEAFLRACELARQIADEYPWNDDAKQLVQELGIAAVGMTAKK